MFKIKYFINQSDKKNVVGARASKQTDIKMYDPIRGLVSKAGAHERSPKRHRHTGILASSIPAKHASDCMRWEQM